MLQKSNILALVGGGKYPKFSKNKLIIWDDHQGKVLSQIRFNSNLIGAKIRKDSIFGILNNKIYIFDINSLQTIAILSCNQNQNGICAISNGYSPTNDFYVSCPYDSNKGKVQIIQYIKEKEGIIKKSGKIINAHDSMVVQIIISQDNKLIATASDRGRFIRLFNIQTGEFITELKRGVTNANISSIVFDITTQFLGCFSDSGTVHIFDIRDISKLLSEKSNFVKKNSGKVKIKERSFAKFKLKEEKSILGFSQDNSIIIITSQAIYYRAGFDIKTEGNCTKLEEHFINVDE